MLKIVVSLLIWTIVSSDYIPFLKDGRCPDYWTSEDTTEEKCPQECTKDIDCTGDRRCCQFDCAHRCILPITDDQPVAPRPPQSMQPPSVTLTVSPKSTVPVGKTVQFKCDTGESNQGTSFIWIKNDKEFYRRHGSKGRSLAVTAGIGTYGVYKCKVQQLVSHHWAQSNPIAFSEPKNDDAVDPMINMDRCSQKLNIPFSCGSKVYKNRYYFHNVSQTCRSFISAGCEGKDAHFDSFDECSKICLACPNNSSRAHCITPCTCETFLSIGSCLQCTPRDDGLCQCQNGFAKDKNNKCVAYEDCRLSNVTEPKCKFPSQAPKNCMYDYVTDLNGCWATWRLHCVPLSCNLNEHWDNCTSGCEPRCDTLNSAGSCSHDCHIGGECVCNESYARDSSGHCVMISQCYTPQICSDENEEIQNCGPACEESCTGVDASCKNHRSCNYGCFCKRGYVRRIPEGPCIPRVQCLATPIVAGAQKCAENEEYLNCGSECQRTCSDMQKPQMCGGNCSNGCFCKSGYVRFADGGQCVLKYDCPMKQESSTNICNQMPHQQKLCPASVERWYYDRQQGMCSPFTFGTCQRTAGNNFHTFEQCMRECYYMNHSPIECKNATVSTNCTVNMCDSAVCPTYESESFCLPMKCSDNCSPVFYLRNGSRLLDDQCNGTDETHGDERCHSLYCGDCMQCQIVGSKPRCVKNLNLKSCTGRQSLHRPCHNGPCDECEICIEEDCDGRNNCRSFRCRPIENCSDRFQPGNHLPNQRRLDLLRTHRWFID